MDRTIGGLAQQPTPQLGNPVGSDVLAEPTSAENALEGASGVVSALMGTGERLPLALEMSVQACGLTPDAYPRLLLRTRGRDGIMEGLLDRNSLREDMDRHWHCEDPKCNLSIKWRNAWSEAIRQEIGHDVRDICSQLLRNAVMDTLDGFDKADPIEVARLAPHLPLLRMLGEIGWMPRSKPLYDAIEGRGPAIPAAWPSWVMDKWVDRGMAAIGGGDPPRTPEEALARLEAHSVDERAWKDPAGTAVLESVEVIAKPHGMKASAQALECLAHYAVYHKRPPEPRTRGAVEHWRDTHCVRRPHGLVLDIVSVGKAMGCEADPLWVDTLVECAERMPVDEAAIRMEGQWLFGLNKKDRKVDKLECPDYNRSWARDVLVRAAVRGCGRLSDDVAAPLLDRIKELRGSGQAFSIRERLGRYPGADAEVARMITQGRGLEWDARMPIVGAMHAKRGLPPLTLAALKHVASDLSSPRKALLATSTIVARGGPESATRAVRDVMDHMGRFMTSRKLWAIGPSLFGGPDLDDDLLGDLILSLPVPTSRRRAISVAKMPGAKADWSEPSDYGSMAMKAAKVLYVDVLKLTDAQKDRLLTERVAWPLPSLVHTMTRVMASKDVDVSLKLAMLKQAFDASMPSEAVTWPEAADVRHAWLVKGAYLKAIRTFAWSHQDDKAAIAALERSVGVRIRVEGDTKVGMIWGTSRPKLYAFQVAQDASILWVRSNHENMTS